MNMTRAQEERMRAENRRKEYQREDHMRLVAQDRVLRANLASDERVENKRYQGQHLEYLFTLTTATGHCNMSYASICNGDFTEILIPYATY